MSVLSNSGFHRKLGIWCKIIGKPMVSIVFYEVGKTPLKIIGNTCVFGVPKLARFKNFEKPFIKMFIKALGLGVIICSDKILIKYFTPCRRGICAALWYAPLGTSAHQRDVHGPCGAPWTTRWVHRVHHRAVQGHMVPIPCPMPGTVRTHGWSKGLWSEFKHVRITKVITEVFTACKWDRTWDHAVHRGNDKAN